MYATRLMISHLREAMWIINDVNKFQQHPQSQIGRLISGMSPAFQEQYALLLRCLPDAPDRAMFDQRIVAIRKVLTLHYKSSTSVAMVQPLSDMARSMKQPVHIIAEGEDVRAPRIALADVVLDRVACRIMLGTDMTAVPDAPAAVAEVIEWCMERVRAFHDFGFALCLAYFEQYSAA